MLEDYLYFIETYVQTINFSYANLPGVPKIKDVVVTVEAGDFLKMEVSSMNVENADEVQKNLVLNCGKSILFSYSPEKFLQHVDEHAIVLQLGVAKIPIGLAQIPWPASFVDLIKKSPDTYGVIGPVKVEDTYILKAPPQNVIVGDIKLSFKLSCFGDSIQTNFQKIGTAVKRQQKYLIRGARGLTTFECQRFRNQGNSSDLFPLSTLYDELPFEARKKPPPVAPRSFAPFDQSLGLSFMALYNANIDPTESKTPEAFNMQFASLLGNGPSTGGVPKTVSTLTFDIISIMERPHENKFTDLRIKANSKGFIIEIDKPKDRSLGTSASATMDSEEEDEQFYMSDDLDVATGSKTKLTVQQITNRLCNHKDCPAAKKFKEFGIGNLAHGRGLGTVYGDDTQPPVLYGMSQQYGVLDEYGPYGIFMNPKEKMTDEMDNWLASGKKYDTEKHRCKTKPSEDDGKPGKKTSPKKPPPRNMCRNVSHPPLRLTGGGVMDFNDVKSPFHECQQIMEQFDDILDKFKKAIGPCGKVTCPFAPNIVRETCKNTCQHPMDFHEEHPYEPPPELLNPPAPQSALKLPHRPACESSKCAYAKYKSGLREADDFMELQYLPPPTSGLCGHPSCPYPVEPELPPIHWDCPDPLPEGPCRNPECPYRPKDLQCLDQLVQKSIMRNNKRTPCGNEACPYTLPDACDSPYCPFAEKDCPYDQAQDVTCDNPECPYNPCFNGGGGNECCNSAGGGEDTCGNPDCVYNQPPYTGDNCMDNNPCYPPQDDGCQNPDCMFSQQPQDPCAMMPMPCPADPCNPPPMCPITMDLCYLQQLLNCCMQVSRCDKPDCPLGVDDVIQICMPGMPCPMPCPPPCPPPPCCVEEAPPQKMGACGNPDCPYAEEGGEEKGDSGDGDSPRPPGVRKYRPSLALDKPLGMDESSPTEHKVDTRTDVDNAPCTSATCKDFTEGPCEECRGDGGDGEKPPGVRQYRASLALDKKIDMDEIAPTEHKTDTRTDVDNAPCNVRTCCTIKNSPCTECHPKGVQSDTGPGKKEKKGHKKTASAPELGGAKKRTGGKRSKGKYVYSIGDKYPGVQVGHKECVMPGFNVPKNQGWLWNIFTPCMSLRPRRGWRPGGVPKSIAEAIRKHRAKQGLQLLELKRFGKRRGYGAYDSGTSINVQPRPTLQIKKKDGCYWITMNPLKDPYSLAENEDPYMECTPMQFKITKNKNNVKVKGEDGEYKTCYCGEEGEEDDECEGEEGDHCAMSESSESELDIEFTPPAGIIHPERFKKKRNVVHCDTQYRTADFDNKSEKSGKSSKKGKGKKGKKGKGKGKKGGKGKGKKGKKK